MHRPGVGTRYLSITSPTPHHYTTEPTPSTSFLAGRVHLCLVAGNTVASDVCLSRTSVTFRSSECVHHEQPYRFTFKLNCWSPRLARSHYCQQYNWLCLSVPISVCHAPSNCFLFFASRSIFWPSVLHVALYKTLFLDFGFVAMATKFGLFFQKFQICFFFVSRWNRAIFGPSVLHDPIYKTLVLRFLI